MLRDLHKLMPSTYEQISNISAVPVTECAAVLDSVEPEYLSGFTVPMYIRLVEAVVPPTIGLVFHNAFDESTCPICAAA